MFKYGKNSNAKTIRKHLTKEKLWYYMILHRMSINQLANRFCVSRSTILNIMKEAGFNLAEEREKYEKQKTNKASQAYLGNF